MEIIIIPSKLPEVRESSVRKTIAFGSLKPFWTRFLNQNMPDLKMGFNKKKMFLFKEKMSGECCVRVNLRK